MAGTGAGGVKCIDHPVSIYLRTSICVPLYLAFPEQRVICAWGRLVVNISASIKTINTYVVTWRNVNKSVCVSLQSILSELVIGN